VIRVNRQDLIKAAKATTVFVTRTLDESYTVVDIEIAHPEGVLSVGSQVREVERLGKVQVQHAPRLERTRLDQRLRREAAAWDNLLPAPVGMVQPESTPREVRLHRLRCVLLAGVEP